MFLATQTQKLTHGSCYEHQNKLNFTKKFQKNHMISYLNSPHKMAECLRCAFFHFLVSFGLREVGEEDEHFFFFSFFFFLQFTAMEGGHG